MNIQLLVVEKSRLAKGKLAALDGNPTMVLKKEVHRETVEEVDIYYQ